jgi:hypothetical protein
MDQSIELQALRTGHDPAVIEEGAPAAMVVSGIVGVTGATLLQTLLLMAVARLLGGRSTFRRAFSAVCHASVPIGVSAILVTALVPFTHKAMTGINLAFAVDRASSPFLWGIANQLDLGMLWFFALLGIAAEPVFDLPRRRARMTALVFAVISVLILGWMGRGEAMSRVDPYEDWSRTESHGHIFRFHGEPPEKILRGVAMACDRAAARVHELTGLTADGATGGGVDGRIHYYLYPSLEEKLRVTDNQAAAHRVEWAGAIHLTWVEGSEAALTRETLKLVDAKAHGKVYTPLVRDGLAVYAGETWAGMPVREAGADLLRRKVLPGLDTLVDVVAFVQLDERISQPAAGSFVAYLVDERGIDVVRNLYDDSAGKSVDVEALLEAALGDSLGGIEKGWTAYLEPEYEAPGRDLPGDG